MTPPYFPVNRDCTREIKRLFLTCLFLEIKAKEQSFLETPKLLEFAVEYSKDIANNQTSRQLMLVELS